MDRGLFVFLIIAALFSAAVWAILARPRDTLPFSRIEEPTALLNVPLVRNNPPLPSFSEERLLPSSQDLPDTLTPKLPPSPDSDLLLSVKPIAVPALPSVFPQNGHSAGDQLPNQPNQLGRGFKGQSEMATVTAKELREHSGKPPSVSLPSPPAMGRHTVADGETLAIIAQRYYRDSTLWTLIYQANQELLPSPELLPIGVELIIPPPPQSSTVAR
ncbi:MAG: LysM peptidoglycan-binding domain-containing protein [Thermogutta sp.]